MPNLSWMEMLVVGIVALIVIGPKDLPGMFRQVGQFVGKAKGMAREFSSAMNAAADESGMNEISKTIKAAANPQKFGANKIREASQGALKGSTKPGGETEALKAKLSDERAANKAKIDKAMADVANKRIASENAAEATPEIIADSAPKKAAPKKTAAKKATAKAAPKVPQTKAKPVKKPTAKKAAPKKTATNTPAKPKTIAKAKTPAKDAK